MKIAFKPLARSATVTVAIAAHLSSVSKRVVEKHRRFPQGGNLHRSYTKYNKRMLYNLFYGYYDYADVLEVCVYTGILRDIVLY